MKKFREIEREELKNEREEELKSEREENLERRGGKHKM